MTTPRRSTVVYAGTRADPVKIESTAEAYAGTRADPVKVETATDESNQSEHEVKIEAALSPRMTRAQRHKAAVLASELHDVHQRPRRKGKGTATDSKH